VSGPSVVVDKIVKSLGRASALPAWTVTRPRADIVEPRCMTRRRTLIYYAALNLHRNPST